MTSSKLMTLRADRNVLFMQNRPALTAEHSVAQHPVWRKYHRKPYTRDPSAWLDNISVADKPLRLQYDVLSFIGIVT